MLELVEIFRLMVELSDESFQDAVENLKNNTNLSKKFVDVLIDVTSEEREKKKIRQSQIA